MSGFQHLVQALPLLALGAWAWKRPGAGGMALMVIGAALGIVYFVFGTALPMSTRMTTVLLIMLPPIVSGGLFFSARQG
jgi:hypothetical protein